MLSDQKVRSILVSHQLLDENNASKLAKEAQEAGAPLLEFAVNKKAVSENALYEAIADFFNLPFIQLEKKNIRKDVVSYLPEATAREHHTVCFDANDTNVMVATLDPHDLEIFEAVKKKTGLTPVIHLASPTGLEEAFKQYRADMQTAFQVAKESPTAPDGKKLQAMSQELPIVKIVDSILEQAFYENASDIHIEPEEKQTQVRYRVDGMLTTVMTLPKKAHVPLVARIKVLADLKVDEHRLPQDGRFKVYDKKNKISFRVSIIPVMNGEKVVMRLLNENPKILGLAEIGLQPEALKVVERNMKKPHGMLLVTGPTGSGKTTTLYTMLNLLNTPSVNISTIEDPIEYHIQHINQSQVNPKIGYTFANGLRAFLRQDPDIIMVGEIRDNETAEIAIHAALTGHLVLSSLHTNDALSTLPRLLEMEVAPYLLAQTTNIIIAQRLVRRICRACIYSHYLDAAEINQLKNRIDIDSLITTLQEHGSISQEESDVGRLLFYKGKGCSECNNTGYTGRTGIYEVLEISNDLAKLIAQGAPKADLEAQADKQNMMHMTEDGFLKAKSGVTTLEEVLRVTQE